MEDFIRSEEVSDILNEPPRWLTRWGITVLLCVLLLLLTGSYFYKYPDIIIADVVLTTADPPVSLIGRVNGQIERIYVVTGQEVSQDETILLIKNPANLDDIGKLKTELSLLKRHFDLFKVGDSAMIDFAFSPYSLGEVQEAYSEMVRRFSEMQSLLVIDYYNKKLKGKKREIEMSKVYYSKLLQQSKTVEQELHIAKNQYLRDSLLYHNHVLSSVDLENSMKQYLQKSYSFQGSEIALANVLISIGRLEQEIADLAIDSQRQRHELLNALYQSYNVVQARIASWEEKYVVKSPIPGTASFSKFWNENQNVQVGETIVTIVPNDSSKFIAKAQTSMHGAGKIKPGLNVNIKLDNYPYMEYGFLKARVSSISKVSENNQYYLDISLNDGLTTSQKFMLPPSQRMAGKAEIITSDKRLIQRIVDPIITILNEGIRE